MAKTAKKATPAKAAGSAKKTAKTAKKGKKKEIGTGSPEKTFYAIKDIVVLMEEDAEKFLVDGVKSAGRRLRVNAQSIRKLCQAFRKEIMEEVKGRAAKEKK